MDKKKIPDYPSNSKVQDEKKIKKVVSGKVQRQKKPLARRIGEVFLEDDTQTVGAYVVYDILIPAAKALINDVVSGGVEMLLFGDRKGHRTRREGGRSFTNYGSLYRSADRDRDRLDRRHISRTSRARHHFDEIVLETRGEAEEVLSHLVDLTVDYGQATVADLYDLVDIESNHTDSKYGWVDLGGADVSRTRGGYVINLPRTQQVD